MESKIQELTNKLLQEGVERGNAQAEAIIAQANEQAKQIIEAAQAKGAEIEAQAKKDAQALNDHTKSELKMYNAQALNALKTEIANVVNAQVVKDAVKDAPMYAPPKAAVNFDFFKMFEKKPLNKKARKRNKEILENWDKEYNNQD